MFNDKSFMFLNITTPNVFMVNTSSNFISEIKSKIKIKTCNL